MKIYLALVSRVLLCMLMACSQLYATDSLITNGMAIAAFGEGEAYLTDNEGNLYKFDLPTMKWQLYAIGAPRMRQMDCFTDGTNLVGTDVNDVARLWNGGFCSESSWTNPRGGRRYHWILLDHVSDETRGMIRNLEGVWESWSQKSGGTWDQYIAAGPLDEIRAKNVVLIDTDNDAINRWERGDLDYLVRLNRSSGSTPFYIYFYGDDEQNAIDTMFDPPVSTKNIDEVVVKQISYDEDNKNLWCIDNEGKPWQWDNDEQEWILRNIAGDEGCKPDKYDDVIKLLKIQNDFYVQTRYIEGDYKPRLIIFKDTYIMHLVLGELSRSDMDQEIDIYILDEPDRKMSKFHNLLLLPKYRPQKIVRIDGGNRIRENHYLERLLIHRNIIPNEDALGVYPSRHRRVRR